MRILNGNKVILRFCKPIWVKDHFQVPADCTNWENMDYLRTNGGKGKSEGKTPNRPKATFGRKSQAMVPKSQLARQLKSATGVYLIAFDCPSPSIYIGIAAKSKSVEGISSRLQKHRIKATASHMHVLPTRNGGVNHTKGWREFAKKRYYSFKNQGIIDCCEDMQISFADIDFRFDDMNHKQTLETIESFLARSEKGLRAVADLFWPGKAITSVRLLTTSSKRMNPDLSLSVLL